MNNDVLDWLREGPAWLKYAVDLQLLGSHPDVQPVMQDRDIQEIIARLKDGRRGIPGIGTDMMNSDEYKNPYWDLFFLADLGLQASQLNLNKEIESFLATQHYDGTYITEMGMEPSYYCKSAILLSAIARMGYQNDPHIQKYLRLFLNSQRLDGGWYCNPNHDIGASLQHEPSCPQNNLNILLLLGQYPQYQNDMKFKGAIDLLLNHWDMRHTGERLVYFGVGRRYQSLFYPATRYGILRVLDSLSLFPYSFKRASFHSMLEFVQRKAVKGKYTAEMSSAYTDLELPGQPSRLLTFIVSRIEKRVSEK